MPEKWRMRQLSPPLRWDIEITYRRVEQSSTDPVEDPYIYHERQTEAQSNIEIL